MVIDVLINMMNAAAIILWFAAMPVSCSVYVLSKGAVDLLVDAWAGVLTVVAIDGLSGVNVLVEVNVNMFAGVMAEVKFAIDGLSC